MFKSNLTPFCSTFYICSIPDNSCPIIGLLIPLSPQHPKPYVTALMAKLFPYPLSGFLTYLSSLIPNLQESQAGVIQVNLFSFIIFSVSQYCSLKQVA